MTARERLNGSACFHLWRGSPAQTHPRSRESGRAISRRTRQCFPSKKVFKPWKERLPSAGRLTPLGLDAVKVRFEAAQGQATRMTSVPDRHLLFKAKSWFESVSEAI